MLEYSFKRGKFEGNDVIILSTIGNKTKYPIGHYQTFTLKDEYIEVVESCKIEKLIKEDVDSIGRYYAWYIVSDYTKNIDKSGEYRIALEKANATIDYLLMINGEDPIGGIDNEQNV